MSLKALSGPRQLPLTKVDNDISAGRAFRRFKNSKYVNIVSTIRLEMVEALIGAPMRKVSDVIGRVSIGEE